MNIVQNQPDWMDQLNPEQKEAVVTTEGPLLVLSGAGTGKTRVLTSKIAYVLWRGLARPWEILAVTFTNKAANEMKARVRGIIGDGADGLWIGTFHSIGLRILKKYVEIAGLKPNFLIFDEGDQRILVRKVMEEELKLDTKKWPPASVLESIQRLKDKGFYFDDENIALADADTINGRLLDIYRRYQARLIENNAADFGDLLLHPLMLFEKNPDILGEFQRKFRYILVDEYQDTNAVQYKLLKLLSAGHGNIACVGDDDQSIYSWRGAEIENILRFERDFKGAKIIRLETNYRSTPHILKAASHLISKNKDRLGKELRPCPALAHDDSLKVQVKGVWNGDEEAREVIDEIELFQRKGEPLREMAILVRAGYQTRTFEEKLVRAGIQYRIIGGLRFYERQEIKDIIAYLRLLAYPQDNLSFERIINVPRRGVGDKTLAAIAEYARKSRLSMFEATEHMLKSGKIGGKAGLSLKKFVDDFERWRAIYRGECEMAAGSPEVSEHSALAKLMLDESGYVEMWRNSKKVEAEAKLENIREFLGILKSDFESIPEFLEYIMLFTESNENAGNDADYVSLMTLHAAKGLEFDVVFLPGWETGIFPNERSAQEAGGSLEEERRLAYVGLTRAKKAVEIFYAGSRLVFGQWQQNMPSVFLFDLPNENVEHTSFSNAYGGGHRGA
jgi:DNA helicase-2/ATP-dependent DNA helicase PcrA